MGVAGHRGARVRKLGTAAPGGRRTWRWGSRGAAGRALRRCCSIWACSAVALRLGHHGIGYAWADALLVPHLCISWAAMVTTRAQCAAAARLWGSVGPELALFCHFFSFIQFLLRTPA